MATAQAFAAAVRDRGDAGCWPAAVRTCRTSRSSFPQRGTDFYADGRSVRPQVENTVARGQLHEDAYFYTGLVERQRRRRDALPGDDGGAGARAGALQRLLHAVPLARGQWRRA